MYRILSGPFSQLTRTDNTLFDFRSNGQSKQISSRTSCKVVKLTIACFCVGFKVRCYYTGGFKLKQLSTLTQKLMARDNTKLLVMRLIEHAVIKRI